MLYTILESMTKDVPNYGRLVDVKMKDISGVEVSGSIWEKQKDGSMFPAFDSIKAGIQIELTMWTAPSGKVSFFPPRKAGTGAKGGANMTKVMEKKQESITKSMDRKEDGIKVSSTFRDATILTEAWASKQTAFTTADELEKMWKHFRTFLLTNYDVEEADLNKAF